MTEDWTQQLARLERIMGGTLVDGYGHERFVRPEDRAAIAALLARVERFDHVMEAAKEVEGLWQQSQRDKRQAEAALSDLQGKFTEQNMRLGEAVGLLEKWIWNFPSKTYSYREQARAFLDKKAEPIAEPARCAGCGRAFIEDPGKQADLRLEALYSLVQWAEDKKDTQTLHRPDVNIYKGFLVDMWDQVVRELRGRIALVDGSQAGVLAKKAEPAKEPKP